MVREAAVRPESAICAIPSEVCRRICTGQVVVTLAGACKELLDNALDADAKAIEIRVKSFGFSAVEVADDGFGIHSSDFHALCKPHATSKLSEISDFNQLTTFGFRGEALNALCAVSSVTIITRHKEEQIATKLQFDHKGGIKSRENCARPVGTTVTISNLFETLPVRRRELDRTIRKEFCKLIAAVQSLALSRTDVRFCIINTANGKRHQVLLTPGGSASIRDVIVSLFGTRSHECTVLDIVRADPDSTICSLYGIPNANSSSFENIQVGGYVSSCVHGCGRSSADRQFVYFNRRPVDYPKLCRVANEVYQQYNARQYCMLVLFVDVPSECLDVNVSPDKRSVFFEKEKELFALVRSSLLATFALVLGHVGTVSALTLSFKKDDFEQGFSQSKEDAGVVNYGSIFGEDDLPIISAQALQANLESLGTQIGPPTIVTVRSEKPDCLPCTPATSSEGARKRSSGSPDGKTGTGDAAKRPPVRQLEDFSFTVIPHVLNHFGREGTSADDEGLSDKVEAVEKNVAKKPPQRSEKATFVGERNSSANRTAKPEMLSVAKEIADGLKVSRGIGDRSTLDACTLSECDDNKGKIRPASAGGEKAVASNRVGIIRTQQKVVFSLGDLSRRMKKLEVLKANANANKENKNSSSKRAAFVMDDPTAAESELTARIVKSDFGAMKVLGQFNKGFIIVRLREDLFIVDQHASDEKFHFERLQKKARLQSQALIAPKVLDIGALEEALLQDNIELFSYNGFEFRIDERSEVGKRVMLTSVPALSNLEFEVSDVEEILSVLRTFPGAIYRPLKLRRLFASRACRKSVMIGTALSVPKMEKIVHHLGALDHPWNCPHGRPTLRHLCALDLGGEQVNSNSSTEGFGKAQSHSDPVSASPSETRQ